jgi:hypothetical protein
MGLSGYQINMSFKLVLSFPSWMLLSIHAHHITIGVLGCDVNGIVEGTYPYNGNGEEKQCCFLFRPSFAVLWMHALP